MSEPVVYVGSIGFRLTFVCTDADTGDPIDFTGATSTEVAWVSPSGAKRMLDATPYGDPADGVLEYETVAGDISMPGAHLAQPQPVLASGEVPRCAPITVTVGRSL